MVVSDSILEELQNRSAQWSRKEGAAIHRFIVLAEEKYTSEIDRFLHVYQADKRLGPILHPILEEIREYLLWMRWVGWNVSNLGPALYQDPTAPTQRLALAMLAYVAGRLIDDGMDNHKIYKGHRKTLVAIVSDRLSRAPDNTGCLQSVFIGFCLFNYALRRMHDSSFPKCADIVHQLFEVSSVGALAECYVGPTVSEDLYRDIIRRKAVAYNMILYKPLLIETEDKLRLQLLENLATMDELAQIVNDYGDIEEDQKGNQMNAFTHGVFDVAALESEVLLRMQELLTSTSRLPSSIQDALATMLNNTITARFLELPVTVKGLHHHSGS